MRSVITAGSEEDRVILEAIQQRIDDCADPAALVQVSVLADTRACRHAATGSTARAPNARHD